MDLSAEGIEETTNSIRLRMQPAFSPVGEPWHPRMRVEGVEELEGIDFCADSWCTGCGLPVLMVGQDRCVGSMCAHGPVVQPFRVEWKGKTRQLPAIYHDVLRRRYWL